MYFKTFGYGHDHEEILEFIKWWIKSECWDKDIKIGESWKGCGGPSIRDIAHTVSVQKQGSFDLIIEKNVIMSDEPSRGMKKGEFYLNKGPMNGFIRAAKKIEIWLESRWDYDPCEIDAKKAYEKGLIFDTVGIGFIVETVDQAGWKLRVRADVVGIPK